MQLQLNPQVVHDAAANLFWSLAAKIGVAEANEKVIESRGRCLLEHSFSQEILATVGMQDVLGEARTLAENAILEEAEHHAIAEENMQGLIFAEDAAAGRSPSASSVNTAPLNWTPMKVTRSGAPIQRMGSLCLRHPLPAVVFTHAVPSGPVLEVDSTCNALGFHLPMFLSNLAVMPIDENLFVCTGVLAIPVPDLEQGKLWNQAILNSMRFVRGIKLCGDTEVSTVDVEW